MNQDLSTFERLQFGATRIIVIAILVVAWLAIAGVGVFAYRAVQNSATYVSAEEMQTALTGGVNPAASGSDASGAVVPENLREFFNRQNGENLDRWLGYLTPQQRQDYLDNLSQLVALTPHDRASEVISGYRALKLKKLAASPLAKYEQAGKIVVAATAVVISLILLVLAGAVLLLLAIERNTRRSAANLEFLTEHIRAPSGSASGMASANSGRDGHR